jgi:tetratricopeptide (TPR) repeat protein
MKEIYQNPMSVLLNCCRSVVVFGSISVVGYGLPVLALSPVEVQRIAKQVTVRIKDCNDGSGVIVKKKGSTYMILTAAHAARSKQCKIVTADDREYSVTSIAPSVENIDLTVVTFNSDRSYPIAKLTDNSNRVESGESIYVSGFPLTTTIVDPIFTFVPGKVVGNGNKLQRKGYSMVYDNHTLPGHSGGPVWNDRGEVVAIHGQGDVDVKLQETDSPNVRIKTGFNLGITINTFMKISASMGMAEYAEKPVVKVKPIAQKPVDDLIASAIVKETKGDYRGILADMNEAIAIDPNKERLYYIRANAKAELGDRQGAISDYTRDIQMNPKRAEAYYNRGNMLYKSRNWQQALADYDQAINLDPRRAAIFYNRANVKYQLKDKQGAIDDYTRSISTAPRLLAAYSSRGWVKYETGDYAGALADYNLAIAMNHPLLSKMYSQKALALYELGDRQGAIAAWRNAINTKDFNEDTQIGLAIALYHQNQREEAFQLGTAALRANKKLLDLKHLADKNWGKGLIRDAAPFFQTSKMQAAGK